MNDMTEQTPPRERRAYLRPLVDAFHAVGQIGQVTPGINLFAVATFAPVPLIALGAVLGGLFPWLALIWIAGLTMALDRLIARAAPDAPADTEFPAADALSVALGLTHFLLLFIVVGALAGVTELSLLSRIVLMIAAGQYFGQVSNSNAHELIHRSNKLLFVLGKWVYISLLYGHHTSAHRLVHHRFVATPGDPNTAALGESFWSFVPRAWGGAFIAGYEMESTLRDHQTPRGEARRFGDRLAGLHPYLSYVLGALWFVLLMGLVFGFWGVVSYVLLCLYAQMQILLADYVQHYGLVRQPIDEERYEPVTENHSWDAPDPASSLFMLNAPRHSDHHAHPSRPYPELRLGDLRAKGRPVLPRSLPAMASLALVPPLWHRMMDERVLKLRKPV